MNLSSKYLLISILPLLFFLSCTNENKVLDNKREIKDFNKDWKFSLNEQADCSSPAFNDSGWRSLQLPHDWSIEGAFNKDNPAGIGGGALPGGLGWYRKTFKMNEGDKGKNVFIDFDGVYRNSEVWFNGKYLGKRPFGYISFRYDLTPHLKFGDSSNVIAVKVDNSQQPNSRWYSGSGIYRNVWLVVTDKVFVDHFGTCITTSDVSDKSANVSIKTKVRNSSDKDQKVTLVTVLFNSDGKDIAKIISAVDIVKGATSELDQSINVSNPSLWSIERPGMYKAISYVSVDGSIVDNYETPFGIRDFSFDREKGFYLNGKPLKIKGVCNHHDLGCLGVAVNTRAIERQLEIMKEMGVNGIRTSHNPPAPELLDLCDKMGFIVMDEAFDMWKKKKTEFDYHLDWDQWHKRDLEDLVLRDRNHPSVFVWSIGNEVSEQYGGDSTAAVIARELASIVRSLDKTRPVTAACNEVSVNNGVITSGALDLVGTNYAHEKIDSLPILFKGQKFIGTETNSSLHTRGHYDMPSDKVRIWPIRWDIPLTTGNPDNTCSAYDNCRAPWGATHEDMWKIAKKSDYFSGMYIWTAFDYLGEPTPYLWPSRSSYFGIVDLAGFPKDPYYMYQSEWTSKGMLHIFPHWNWKAGQKVDVWAYYNNADEVELFLNEKSLGIKKKAGEDLRVTWNVLYQPGELKAISRKEGKEVLTKIVNTAGEPAKILLEADRSQIKADGKDLSFITVKVVDKDGNLVPDADQLINFEIEGEGIIAGVDNGSQTSHESFKASFRKAFNGLCLVIVQSKEKQGKIRLTAKSDKLESASIEVLTK